MNLESPSQSGLNRSQKRAPDGRLSKTVRMLSTALLRLLTLLVVLLLALPVAVLPISSGVPAPVWIILTLVIVSLVILLFRYHWTLRAVGTALIGMVLVILVATVASQMYAATPPITGVDGDPCLYMLYAQGLGKHTGAYYDSINEFSHLAHPYSNEKEIIALNADSGPLSDPYWPPTLAHEFPHMIHWYQNRNAETWLNEGASMLA
jgi:hypothetical protein